MIYQEMFTMATEGQKENKFLKRNYLTVMGQIGTLKKY